MIENQSDFGNTYSRSSFMNFFHSENLSLLTNPVPNRYVYPVYPVKAGPPIILNPDSPRLGGFSEKPRIVAPEVLTEKTFWE